MDRTEKRRKQRQICEQTVYNLRSCNVLLAIFVCVGNVAQHSAMVMSFPRNEEASVWVDRHISEIALCGLY